MTNPDDTAPRHLREAKRQARSFERVRQAHQRVVAEDYVELIADLIDVTGEARAVDLAERLGVTNATVNNTLNRLTREVLVTRQRYRSIFLTETGQLEARVLEPRRIGDAGVVHEDVDLAELLLGRRDDRMPRRLVGDIEGLGDDLVAGGAQLVSELS